MIPQNAAAGLQAIDENRLFTLSADTFDGFLEANAMRFISNRGSSVTKHFPEEARKYDFTARLGGKSLPAPYSSGSVVKNSG